MSSFRQSGNFPPSPSPFRASAGPGTPSSKVNSKSIFAQPVKPPVPAAKELFEPHLKFILRRRLITVFALCAATALLYSAVYNYTPGIQWSEWIMKTIGRAGMWWIGGMVPPIVARKAWVKGVFLVHLFAVPHS